MKRITPLGLASLASLVFLAPGPVMAADIALVIGNFDYRHAPNALSARADASAVAEALEQYGYEVISGIDLDRGEMRRRFDEFAARLDDSDAADRVVVFYSGHTLRRGGVTYLAPVDQDNASLVGVMMDGVPLELVLRLAGREPGKAVVFIDGAQLDGFSPNAFAEPGLADIKAPDGVLIVLAAAPGRAIPRHLAGQSAFGRKVVAELLAPGVSVGSAVHSFHSPAWITGDTDNNLVLVRKSVKPVASRSWTGVRTAPTAPESKVAAEQRLAFSGAERQAIQRNLTALGYDTHSVNGIFGSGTRAALRRWQRANEIARTGYLTRPQVALLNKQANAAVPTEPHADDTGAAGEENSATGQERAYWARTGARGTGDGHRSYLRSYPNGVHSADSRKTLRHMADNGSDPAAVRERELWRRIQVQNRRTGYQTYLESYPNGIWQPEATARLAEIAAEEALPVLPDPATAEAALALTSTDRLSIEQRLAVLGFRPGTQDGVFDANTRTAIAGYQRSRGHDVTGYLSRPTIAGIVQETRGANAQIISGAEALVEILRALGKQ